MTRFLFRFGYETPAQRRDNQAHGWDDECSGAFFVLANDSAQALAWGQEVAEAFVARQFKEQGCQEVPGWKEDAFAFWIEDNPSSDFSSAELEAMPQVSLRVLPDFTHWDC